MSIVAAGLTEQQAIDKVEQTFNHNVRKYPLFGPDNTPTGYFGLFDKDFNIIGTSSVTNDYHVHTCDDMVALAKAAFHAFGGAMDVNCSFNTGHRLIIQPSLDFRKAVYGTRDNIFGRVMITAPYIAGCLDASLGLWRDACNNMSVLRMVKGVTTKIRHTKGLTSKMDILKAEFSELASGWQNVIDAADQMENNRVLLSDFLIKMYGPVTPEMDEKQVKKHEDRTKEITSRLLAEHVKTRRPAFTTSKFEVTGWQAYNAVQGWRQHDSKRSKGTTDTDRIWKALDDDQVIKAERLALIGV